MQATDERADCSIIDCNREPPRRGTDPAEAQRAIPAA